MAKHRENAKQSALKSARLRFLVFVRGEMVLVAASIWEFQAGCFEREKKTSSPHSIYCFALALGLAIAR